MPAELHRDFERRFGLTVSESWGMTECAYGTRLRNGISTPGRVGYESEWLSLIVVDDNDNEVPDGVTGEICFRSKIPFVMFKGYWRKDEETVASFRNLWFHTGDLARRDADGQFEFVGRKKDSIRRRGENISAWEVEQAACRHPDVLEAAAIGVPSELGEEDVAIFCVPVPGQTVQPEVLIEFMERDLQRFAVPRYVEFVDELPKTPSERIKKGELKERGISDTAWDANVALGRR
jgi:crotonobetaine/carnitine-CoA ligase